MRVAAHTQNCPKKWSVESEAVMAWAAKLREKISQPTSTKQYISHFQSQKTQGFSVADFATLSDERRSRSKISILFIWTKEPFVRKFEGLKRSKLLGISQTTLFLCIFASFKCGCGFYWSRTDTDSVPTTFTHWLAGVIIVDHIDIGWT